MLSRTIYCYCIHCTWQNPFHFLIEVCLLSNLILLKLVSLSLLHVVLLLKIVLECYILFQGSKAMQIEFINLTWITQSNMWRQLKFFDQILQIFENEMLFYLNHNDLHMCGVIISIRILWKIFEIKRNTIISRLLCLIRA